MHREARLMNRLLLISGAIFFALTFIAVLEYVYPGGSTDLPATAETSIQMLAVVTWVAGFAVALLGLLILLRPRDEFRTRRVVAVIDVIAILILGVVLVAGVDSLAGAQWDAPRAVAGSLRVAAVGKEVAHQTYAGSSLGGGDPPTIRSTRICGSESNCAAARRAFAARLRLARFQASNPEYWTRTCGTDGFAKVFVFDKPARLRGQAQPALEITISANEAGSRC